MQKKRRRLERAGVHRDQEGAHVVQRQIRHHDL